MKLALLCLLGRRYDGCVGSGTRAGGVRPGSTRPWRACRGRGRGRKRARKRIADCARTRENTTPATTSGSPTKMSTPCRSWRGGIPDDPRDQGAVGQMEPVQEKSADRWGGGGGAMYPQQRTQLPHRQVESLRQPMSTLHIQPKEGNCANIYGTDCGWSPSKVYASSRKQPIIRVYDANGAAALVSGLHIDPSGQLWITRQRLPEGDTPSQSVQRSALHGHECTR